MSEREHLETPHYNGTINDRDITDDSKRVSKIIINSFPEAYAFDRNCYSPRILSDIMTKNEFYDIIFQANKVLGESLNIKNKSDIFVKPKRFYPIKLFCLACLIFYIIFCYIAKGVSESKGIAVMVFALIFAASALIIIVYQSVSSFFAKTREYRPLDDIIKSELDKYLNQVNTTLMLKGKTNVKFYFIVSSRTIECQVISDKKDIDSNNSTVKYMKNFSREEGEEINSQENKFN